MMYLLNHWYINSAISGSSEDWAYYLNVIHQGYNKTDKYIGVNSDDYDELVQQIISDL